MFALKRLLRRTSAQSVGGWLIACYVMAIRRLGGLTIHNAGIADDLTKQGRPFIACYWHSRILMFPYFWGRQAGMNMLISRHRDGRLISHAGRHFGYATIVGSSSQGGSQAVRAMIRALKAGECVAVTPDGPRGPRMRVSHGVVHTARLAGVPLVPIAFAASRRMVMRSWDRFIVPLPFSDFHVRIGGPIQLPPDADDRAVEDARRLLEERLNDMTVDLEAALGLKPVEPEPPIAEARAMEAAGKG